MLDNIYYNIKSLNLALKTTLAGSAVYSLFLSDRHLCLCGCNHLNTHKMTISMDSSARKGELSHPAIAVFLSVQTYQPCKSSLAVIIVPASCHTHAVISERDSGRSMREHKGVWSSDGHVFLPCIHFCNPAFSFEWNIIGLLQFLSNTFTFRMVLLIID